MFTNYCLKETDASCQTKKAKANEKIQEIITLIQFANGKYNIEINYCIYAISTQKRIV